MEPETGHPGNEGTGERGCETQGWEHCSGLQTEKLCACVPASGVARELHVPLDTQMHTHVTDPSQAGTGTFRLTLNLAPQIKIQKS